MITTLSLVLIWSIVGMFVFLSTIVNLIEMEYLHSTKPNKWKLLLLIVLCGPIAIIISLSVYLLSRIDCLLNKIDYHKYFLWFFHE